MGNCEMGSEEKRLIEIPTLKGGTREKKYLLVGKSFQLSHAQRRTNKPKVKIVASKEVCSSGRQGPGGSGGDQDSAPQR